MLAQLAGYYSQGAGAAPAPLLLDIPELSGVTIAAAYSVARKLHPAYSGSAIRVRRSSDSVEQDIGFVGEDLDTAALLAFVGAGDGLIVRYYGQSAAAVNANNTVSADQHRIVQGGVLVTLGGKPAAELIVNTGRYTLSASISVETAKRFSTFAVGAPDQTSGPQWLSQWETVNWIIGFPTDSGQTDAVARNTFFDGAWRRHDGTLLITGNHYVGAWRRVSDGQLQFRVNGTQHGNLIPVDTLGDASAAATTYLLGSTRATDAPRLSKFQEIVHLSEDSAAAVAAMEINANSYYGVY